MQTNQAYYFSVGVNDIPWDRLVHWYGRATDFSALFHDLLSDEPATQKAAIQALEQNIEHQDGIIMATPFTLLFLMRLLSFERANKSAILNTVLTVLEAAKFQLEFYQKKVPNERIDHLQQLLADQYIWPLFESEEQDEIHWEEYDYGHEHYYWLTYIFDIVRSFSFLLTMFKENEESATAAKILNITA